MTAIIEVDHKMLSMLIDESYRTKTPLCCIGTTGIGKSQLVREKSKQTAKQLNREFIDWNKASKEEKLEILNTPEKYFLLIDKRLSEFDPSDLRGIPSLDNKDYSDWKAPLWLYAICRKGVAGILFFDEMNLAPPSIQSAAYQLINDRELDEMPLAEGIGIITAGNRIEDKANVYDMAKPLQNRFIHCNLNPPYIDDWVEWAMKHDVDARIMSFLKFKPTYLFKFDPDSKDRAFPTPRSWGEFCTRLIKDKPSNNDTQRKLVKTLVSTAVGGGTAVEFTAFLKLQDKIDLNEIINKPELAKSVTEKDLLYSLLSLVAEWYRKNYKKADLEKVLKIATNVDSEFGILMMKFVKECHPNSFERNAPKCNLWKKLARDWGKYILG